jgi:hypothetical protein
LETLYQRSWDLLDEHREQVLALAAVLEERKTISGDEVAEIMGSPPGARSMREPTGWSAVDERTAEERRLSALARLPVGTNAHTTSSDGDPDQDDD